MAGEDTIYQNFSLFPTMFFKEDALNPFLCVHCSYKKFKQGKHKVIIQTLAESHWGKCVHSTNSRNFPQAQK